jgi:hypothetical protein
VKHTGKDGKMEEFQWINAPAAVEKRLSRVLHARGQGKDLRDFSPKNARRALGQESALVLSVAAPASFKLRHNQTDYEPRAAMHSGTGRPRERGTSGCRKSGCQ